MPTTSTSDASVCCAVPVCLEQEEQIFLGQIARLAIVRGLTQGQASGGSGLPQPPFSPDSAVFAELGAFVTLTRQGMLRGCIGSMIGRGPLYRTVADMAYASAFRDHRFAPLQAQEWPETELSISVLGPLSPCPDPDRIEIGRHGLLLTRGSSSGVFLPQVPVEQGWDRKTYLHQLCGKAGLPPESWLAPDARLYWYEAFVFSPATSDKRD